MLSLLVLLLVAAPSPTDCEPGPEYGRASACEVRTFTLDVREGLTVRNPVSGGITVQTWDQSEISVRAEVRAYETQGRSPAALLEATTIQTDDTLQPETEGGGWVETRFVISVPRETDLDLWSNNGSIAVTGVEGTLRIDTNNGAVRLAGVAGDVDARSNNGSVLVDLDGTTWTGSGLRAFTNNGTLRLLVPDGYDALVEAEVNWGYINEPNAFSPSAATQTIYFGPGSTTLRVGVNSGSVQIERN
ncbi:MAG: hypothetical protein AAGI52_18315 [Bacteroidota bacterium]